MYNVLQHVHLCHVIHMVGHAHTFVADAASKTASALSVFPHKSLCTLLAINFFLLCPSFVSVDSLEGSSRMELLACFIN